MARDEGLEILPRDMPSLTEGLTEMAMFGGRAWLLYGNLLYGAAALAFLKSLPAK